MSRSVCPLCNSSIIRVLYQPVVQCSGCGLARTQGVYALKHKDVFAYEKEYFTERNDYIARKAEFTGYFGGILDEIQAYKSCGRLLDVGCGPGLLLNVARERGYAVSGCDISEWATNYASTQGWDISAGELESIHFPDKHFDVVIINHTLEHVPQPVPMLRETRRILADDGILVVGVPNFASLMAQLLRFHWAGLVPDQHRWHFEPRTLKMMLAHAGFQIRRLVVQPSSHQHSNWATYLVLRCLTTLGNAMGRGESLLVIAAKNKDAT